MKKLAVAGLVAISVLGVSRLALAGTQDFTVVNETGLVISELYVSESSNDNWEEDVLGSDVLGNDESTKITFNNYQEGECSFDIKIVDNHDEAWTVNGVNLCKTSTVTFRREGNKVVYYED